MVEYISAMYHTKDTDYERAFVKNRTKEGIWMVFAEVSAPTSRQSNADESNQDTIGLLVHDEVTDAILLIRFTLEEVFDRNKWGDAELPSILLQQKKRARSLP